MTPSIPPFSPGPRGRTVASAVAVLVLLALVVPFVVYAVPAAVGGDASYIVLTASMEPELSPGDAVVVRDVPASQIVEGDVITFERRGSDVPVTHRVVGVVTLDDGTRAFLTKGDANEDRDAGVVRADDVVGKLALTIPYIGHVIVFVNSPEGFVALVVLPIVLLIANEALGIVRSGRRSATSDGPDGDATSDGPDDDHPGASVDGGSTGTVGAVDATAGDGGSDDIVLTRTDLTFTAVALAAFAAYAGYVAVEGVRTGTFDALAIAVAIGSVGAFGLVVVVRQFAIPAEEPPTADTAHHDDAVPTVKLDGTLAELPRIRLDGRAALDALAAETGRPLVRDAAGTHLVVDGDVVYEALDTTADGDDGNEAEGSDDPIAATTDTVPDRAAVDGEVNA